MLFRRSATIAIALAFSITAFAQDSAAHKAQLDKDMVEIQHYTLTMDSVTTFFVASGALRDAVKADPALQKQSAADNNEDGQPTLDHISEILSRSPKVVAILAAHNFTPRSYAVAEMSVIVTAIVAAAVQSGASMADMLSKTGANEANVKLFLSHKAELDELGKKYPLQDPN